MDLLAKRWANPFLMLDEFIKLNQLHEMMEETMKTIADEKIHDLRWNFYLHKVFDDISFEEYVEACEKGMQNQNRQEMSHQDIGDIIADSRNMVLSTNN